MSIDVSIIDYAEHNASAKFENSLKSSGFAIIKNHPIDHELIQLVYNDWRKFFNNENKHDLLFDKIKQDGYFPYLTENAKNSATKDLKEFYHIYSWGKFPETMGPSTMILYNEIVSFASQLLGWIEETCPLEIKNNFSVPLNTMIERSSSNLLRIIHYPPIKDSHEINALRAAAHEDINLITVLLAGSEPGLQAQDLNGEWHDIGCDKNTIVVNSGDMLKIASNNYYPSTTHRVINPDLNSNVSRYSMPLFLHPRDEVKLSTKHTAGSYLNKRLREIGLK